MFQPELLKTLRGYTAQDLRADLAAGAVVGLVALPLAMAFAIASGLPPERGLYTAVVAGFLISALGGSRVQIGGPTGAFVVIVSGIVAKFGYEGLALATCMAGILLVVLGMLKLGSLVKFIPYSVTTGFTSGIALIIFSTQVKDLLGLSMAENPAEFVEKWGAYAGAIGTFNPAALGISVFTVACIGLWPKSWSRFPGSVVALVVAAISAWYFDLPVETIQSRFGGVPQGLPAPHLLMLRWSDIRQLVQPAMTIALLAAIESLLSAVVADGMTGHRHHSNTELIAQGAANIVVPLFGGFCATGAIARTATNIKNGGRTPVAGIVHALVLLAILLVAGPYAARIPLAALAGVLVVVSYHMSEWRSFKNLLLGPGSDRAVLLTSFLLTVFIDLTVAVEVGMVMSAFLFMKQMADLTQVKALTRESGSSRFESDPSRQGLVIPKDVEVFEMHGSFFFGAASQLLETMRFVDAKPRAVILDMRGVLHMDASGMRVLESMHTDCAKRGMRLLISGIHSQPLFTLQESGKLELLGEDNLKGDLKEALESL